MHAPLLRRLVALSLLGASTAGLGLLLSCGEASMAAEQAAIQQVLMLQFDRPDARLAVAPVVVQGAHALAGWTQGERGGRALLRRTDGQWRVTVCGGDGLRSPQALVLAGLAKGDAAALSQAAAVAEAALPASQRAKFSTFGAEVRIDGPAHPPSGHNH